MNTGQMLLTLGAMTLFGIQLIGLNTSELSTSEDVNNAKFSIMAVALAKSRIDNAFGLKFDANTVYNNAYPDANGNPAAGSFTAANGMGCSDQEKTNGQPDEKKFNDFDDYHNVTAVIDTLPSAEFQVTSVINYVDAANGFAPVNVITWDKMITVTVTSPSLQAPIVISAINSYWKY